MSYFDQVHRLFDALDPHAANGVRALIDRDEWAAKLTAEQRDELERDVRSLDPINLSKRKAVTA